MFNVTVSATTYSDLVQQLRRLIVDLDHAFSEPLADMVRVAEDTNLNRAAMDTLLWDYQARVCDGEHVAVQDLIRRHSGELSLYHAPISTWPAIADEAAQALQRLDGAK